jgi:hypothetical protein
VAAAVTPDTETSVPGGYPPPRALALEPS